MGMFEPYTHRVQYYETDQMGIVHHSNYIRWFEEARIDLMRQAGILYREMESAGVVSPVLKVAAEYRTMVRFDDVVLIKTCVKKFNGIVMDLCYEVTDSKTGELRCTGKSRHCFLDSKGNPVSLKKSNRDYFDRFVEMAEEES
jgi:acyl-CoA thioester hydrolase